MFNFVVALLGHHMVFVFVDAKKRVSKRLASECECAVFGGWAPMQDFKDPHLSLHQLILARLEAR